MNRIEKQILSNAPHILHAVQQGIGNVFREQSNNDHCTIEGLESRTMMSAVPAQVYPPAFHLDAIEQLKLLPRPYPARPRVGTSVLHNVASAKPVKAHIVAPVKTKAPVIVKAHVKAKAPVKAKASAPVKAKAPVKTKTPVKAKASSEPLTLAKPSNLILTPIGPTSVTLTWTPGDNKAAGFVVLRATDNVHFSQIAKTTSATLATYTDATALSFHRYSYEVKEYNGTLTSPASAAAAATTPLAAPKITAIVNGPNAVQIAWPINEPQAAGYYILRSTDGTNFTRIGQVGAIKTGAYLDTTATSATAYSYEVEAFNGSNTSAVSQRVTLMTQVTAPSTLAAANQNGAVNLTWTDDNPAASGYYIFRLDGDGKIFGQIANVTSGSATSYSDASVLSGHVYSYKVQAYAGSATSTLTGPIAISTPLAAPSALATSAITATNVALTWADNDANTAGYYVLRGTDGVKFATIATVTGKTTAAYTDKTAVSGTTYDYEVEAFASAIVSAPSSMSTITLPLAGPISITAAAVSPTSVNITWQLSDPLATGYSVLRSTNGGDFTQVATITGKSTLSWTDTTAVSATVYSYEVRATNSNNTSAISRPANVVTPLIAPTALMVTAGNSGAQLSWTDNDPAAAGYLVFRLGDNGKYSQIANVTGPNAMAYTDASILTGHAYIYEVQAYQGSIVSAITGPITLTVALGAPSGLSATTNSASSIALAWTDNDADAAGYYVLRGTDGVHFTQIAKLTGAAFANYIDTTGLSDTTYFYEVQGYNGTILSSVSGMASTTTLLATPTGLTATATSPTSVQLDWTNMDAQSNGYDVLRSADGTNYTQITQILSAKNTSYMDTTAASAGAYSYEVEAISSGNHSAMSVAANTKTPLIAPSSLLATTANGGIHLAWIDNDANATGYYILRNSNGQAFTQVANITSASAASFIDIGVLSGRAYAYEVQAYNSTMASALTAPVSINTLLAAPSSLAIMTSTVTGIQIGWTNNDVNAAGYNILRSTDGVNFSAIAKLANANTATYTDTQISTGKSYTYEVQAYVGTIVSAMSNTAVATTPLATPLNVTATVTGAYVNLTWTGKDTSAIGYNILRSTDNATFTQLKQVTGLTSGSYADTTVSAGQTYYYQVQAYNGSTTSAVSLIATVSMPSGNIPNGVSVIIRFGDELVITAAGMSDSVSIVQSGSTLTITGDGQTFTDAVPAAGVFVYTRGGSDSITINGSVSAATTVDTIDGANTVINNSGSHVSAWIDSTDTLIGSTTATHGVASFVGGVSKALGASLANPTDAGTTKAANLSLFGAGPVAGDVNQGSVGDCYFLSSLAAFAGESPQTLTNAAVDLGDGTYAVQFYSKGSPVYVRVSNQFTTGYFDGYAYAHPGSNNTIWAMVMEKAFCDFRTGANTYASINSGFMDEVYTDLGVKSTFLVPSAFSDSTLFNMLQTDLANGEAVTFGTQNAPNLVSSHAYTLVSVSTVNGVNEYVVRNPWGISGDSLENSQGYATLTFAQMKTNFVEGIAAMA